MPPTYNTPNPNVPTLDEILTAAPNMQQDAVTAYFHKASAQHNALALFTGKFDPNAINGGQTSVFCEKTELRAGGKQRVHFNTIGLPAGPGVRGDAVLTGNESRSSMLTYEATVDWVRDAIVLTEDDIAHIEAGGNLKATLMSLLSMKMGLHKQNAMLRRLIDFAYNLATPGNWANGVTRGNVYRVGNRANIHALTPDDTLSIDVSNTSRSLLSTMGAKPLRRDMSKTGSPINKYLMFATDTALLPIRNDSLFATAKDADVRGKDNANFTGELLDWQGNPFYEFPVTDQAWDDFQGGPLIAKAKVGVAAAPGTVGGPKLIVNASNTKSLYFQWFDGFRYPHSRLETAPDLSTVEYYGWACNPDGSRVFFAYNGNHNGNQITITKILSPAVSDTTIDATTVGQLTCGTASLTGANFAGGGDTNLPTNFTYSNTIAAGAVIFQANSQGTLYTRSFMLASCAGLIAHGKVKMAEIGQNFDYDFVMGNGFQMIFGTGVALDPLGRPNGYLLIEHAFEPVGYPCPAKA
jgi:hypothetical protein